MLKDTNKRKIVEKIYKECKQSFYNRNKVRNGSMKLLANLDAYYDRIKPYLTDKEIKNIEKWIFKMLNEQWDK